MRWEGAMTRCVMRWLAVLSIAALVVIATAGSQALAALRGGSDTPKLAELVFVTEDRPDQLAGCDMISVMQTESNEAVFRAAKTISSPARLASTSDFSLVLASAASNTPGPLGSLYGLKHEGSDWQSWSVMAPINISRLAPDGGIVIMPDNNVLLLSLIRNLPPNRAGIPVQGPYHVGKYYISEIEKRKDEWFIGPSHGEIEVPYIAAEILASRDGRYAHVVTEGMTVITVDVTRMEEVAPRISMAKFILPSGSTAPVEGGYWVGHIHASTSADGRYLVTNRGGAAEINVADLIDRRAWTANLAGGPEGVGGTAINLGWKNAGRLVVRESHAVAVYEFKPTEPPVLLARMPLAEPGQALLYGAIAWSGSGAKVITSVAETGTGLYDAKHFAVLELGEDNELRIERYLQVCLGPVVAAPDILSEDILTANGLLTPPPTPTAVPTATTTAIATATTTAMPPTPSPSSTAS